MTANNWYYQEQPIQDEQLDGYVAFVYVITNLENGRKYIGKKRLKKKTSKKPLKGKKRRRITIKESDWRDYFGSNDELIADVQRLGPDKFSRVIVRLCRTLGESSYYEAKEQFATDCILSNDFYNFWISCKIHKKHMPKN